jgi:hypothetical protein
MPEKKHKINDLLEGTGLDGTYKYLYTVYNYFLDDGSAIWSALQEKKFDEISKPYLTYSISFALALFVMLYTPETNINLLDIAKLNFDKTYLVRPLLVFGIGLIPFGWIYHKLFGDKRVSPILTIQFVTYNFAMLFISFLSLKGSLYLMDIWDFESMGFLKGSMFFLFILIPTGYLFFKPFGLLVKSLGILHIHSTLAVIITFIVWFILCYVCVMLVEKVLF